MRDKILEVMLSHGSLLEPDAAEYILSMDDPMGYVRKLLEAEVDRPLVLTENFLRSVGLRGYDGHQQPLARPEPELASPPPTVPEQKQSRQKLLDPGEPGQKKRLDAFHLISDVTGNSTCDGSIEDFTRCFRNRYRVLRRIIRSHVEMGGVGSIEDARVGEREVKIVGMVMDVNRTKNGHLGVTVEDDTGEVFVFISKDSPYIDTPILKDEVLGFVGRVVEKKYSGPASRGRDSTMFIPSAIYWPDVPRTRKPHRTSADTEVVFMSDIHAGSSHFLHDAWKNFTDWIRGPAASRVRYLVVAGDLVDGIGVYPNQKDELEITDIYEQYRELARLLEPVPEHVSIILQPGNHDAVRPAEPQPALAERFRENFGTRYRFVGNPSYFSIEGVEILSYHGRSIDDLVASIPGITYSEPLPAMVGMLKRRHLAVTYGGKTPLSPEPRDYMVINPVPDIFVTGHVHRTGVGSYGGVTLVNASAWQSQTPFQRMHNFHPDPGKVVVTSLKTGKCRVVDFNA